MHLFLVPLQVVRAAEEFTWTTWTFSSFLTYFVIRITGKVRMIDPDMTLHSLIITKHFVTHSITLLTSFTGNMRVMLFLNVFGQVTGTRKYHITILPLANHRSFLPSRKLVRLFPFVFGIII
ncbi:hypothetical protein GGI43DRAFT_409496 [Trichoderma evansii]